MKHYKILVYHLQKNMSDFYDVNMYTGESDVNDEGLMHTLNYKIECESYFGQCDQVKGSLGALWPQNTVTKNETYFFFPDMCGWVKLALSLLRIT